MADLRIGLRERNLPGFVVISPKSVFQGSPLWGASFLPASYQATWVRDLNNPIDYLTDPAHDRHRLRRQLDTLARFNRIHQRERLIDNPLEPRIASFELAFRMQLSAPEAFDLHRESDATRQLYGIGTNPTDIFGRHCLLARRLVERGVVRPGL